MYPWVEVSWNEPKGTDFGVGLTWVQTQEGSLYSLSLSPLWAWDNVHTQVLNLEAKLNDFPAQWRFVSVHEEGNLSFNIYDSAYSN